MDYFILNICEVWVGSVRLVFILATALIKTTQAIVGFKLRTTSLKGNDLLTEPLNLTSVLVGVFLRDLWYMMKISHCGIWTKSSTHDRLMISHWATAFGTFELVQLQDPPRVTDFLCFLVVRSSSELYFSWRFHRWEIYISQHYQRSTLFRL